MSVSASIVVGIPAVVMNLVQQGLLERSFHDGLFPACMYRAEASDEGQWPENGGTEIFVTRPGLMTPVTKPLVAGADPAPQALSYEQWVARLERYANAIQTHIPTSAVSNSDQFLRNIHQLGLNAGQSLNRIPRNVLFKSYLGGHTTLVGAALAGDTLIHVSSLNGFRTVVLPATQARPVAVSATTPLPITLFGIGTYNVISFVQDDPNDPDGPGWLQLSAAVGGAGAAARTAVLSSQRPLVVRSGGGASVDAIGAADTLVLQDIINATNRLRKNSVPPHEDGYYHCHINTDGNSQIFADPAYQRLATGQLEATQFQEAFIGKIAGCLLYLNSESPDWTNSGARTATNAGGTSFYSEDIGAESTNNAGQNIARTVITGRGALAEKWFDESAYVTEAGVTGKVGEFQIAQAGVQVQTEHVRLILRAPINTLMDQVTAAWSCTTSFATPSDVTTGGAELFKRAIVIEHAMD